MVRRLERALKSSENGRKVKMTTLTRTDLVAAAAAAGFQLNLSNMEKKGKFPTSTSTPLLAPGSHGGSIESEELWRKET